MCIKCARCRIYETMCTPTQDAACRKNIFTITAVFTTPQRQAFVDGTPTVKTGNAAELLIILPSDNITDCCNEENG